MEFRGYIQLHMAQAYSVVSKNDKKTEYINYAKASFLSCYDKNHSIFRVLDSMLN
jgi:hypothetical protein